MLFFVYYLMFFQVLPYIDVNLSHLPHTHYLSYFFHSITSTFLNRPSMESRIFYYTVISNININSQIVINYSLSYIHILLSPTCPVCEIRNSTQKDINPSWTNASIRIRKTFYITHVAVSRLNKRKFQSFRSFRVPSNFE